MSLPRLHRWADAAPRPWRNGGGVTRELFAWPDAADWQLRVSIAEIAADGPFSAFPGVRRWFAVLSGEGVDLGLADGHLRLRAGDEPITFDGAEAPDCRLVDGPTRDLNLMLRRASGGLWAAEAGTAWRPPHHQCGLFARLPLQLQADGIAITLPAMTLAWWPQSPQRLQFGPPPAAMADASAAPAGWWIAFTPHASGTLAADGAGQGLTRPPGRA